LSMEIKVSVVEKKVLFLSRKSNKEFYTRERNKYAGVTATAFFKANGFWGDILRKLAPALVFGDWKNQVKDYDLFIIAASKYGLEIAKYIRARSDKKIIHWYWNPVDTDVNPEQIKGYGCEFYSFDQADCLRYGMNYIYPYYFATIQLPQNKITYDIYFVGADKGRLEQLLQLKKDFESQGLSIEYHITQKLKSQNTPNYAYREEIPYPQVLEGISKCRAILDYVQAGQTGLTQRPLEALFHKKKLITNDININRHDFYNHNNIFILGKDDINSLQEFLDAPYEDVNQKIIDKYDFGSWMEQIMRI
jgi:hypothetical protein